MSSHHREVHRVGMNRLGGRQLASIRSVSPRHAGTQRAGMRRGLGRSLPVPANTATDRTTKPSNARSRTPTQDTTAPPKSTWPEAFVDFAFRRGDLPEPVEQ